MPARPQQYLLDRAGGAQLAQGITRKQQRALSFIQEYIFANDLSPSYEEIQKAIGVSSKSAVHRMVRTLADRGVITFLPNRNRSIKLVGHHRHRKLVEVPADPDEADFETAKAAALAAETDGYDPFWAFWAAMLDRYQREDR